MQQDDHARMLYEQVRGWWTSVLSGQIDQPYPVHSNHVQARLDEDVLIVTGTVPTDEDRQDIQRELDQLIGNGVAEAHNLVVVVADDSGESGLLVQTLVATFETEAHARFAATCLTSQSHVRPVAIHILASGTEQSEPTEAAAVRQLLTDECWEVVRKTLAAHGAIAVVTVDETQAFAAREILDEETRSLDTVVLPPEPSHNAQDIQASPREGAQ